MRFSPAAACAAGALCCLTLQAGIFPTYHLDPAPLKVFDEYVAQFEKNVARPYIETGKLWIDSAARNSGFGAGKPVVEARENTDIIGGSIHHFSGAMHLAGATIADVRHVMQDYPNYPRYFRPDVIKASGQLNPDSSPEDEHYAAHMSLVQSTLWVAVSYDCVYDVHYRYADPHHWRAESSTVSIREWRDPKDVSRGYYADGDDHGFLWRTNTYWFVRDNTDGIDLQVDSMTLSRPVPTGFAWWGTKRTKDAVDKMLRDMKAAVEALHSQHS